MTDEILSALLQQAENGGAIPFTQAEATQALRGIRSELDMLRIFYTAWVGMHTIPADPLHRRRKEAAAQELVDAAHILRRYYQGSGKFDALKPKLELVQ